MIGNQPYDKEGIRSGFGIHPDGNIEGSLGCIVVVDNDILLNSVLIEYIQNKKEAIINVY